MSEVNYSMELPAITAPLDRASSSNFDPIQPLEIEPFREPKNLVKTGTSFGIIRSLQDVITIGGILAKSRFFPDASQESQAIAKIIAGHELGLSAVASLRGIQIIKGNVVLGANLIAGLIKKSKRDRLYDYRVMENTEAVCRIAFYEYAQEYRAWQQCGEHKFTMEEARRANLTGKDVWKFYPKAMLFSRCISAGAKLYCPDLFLGGIYTEEEVEDIPASDAKKVPAPHFFPLDEEGERLQPDLISDTVFPNVPPAPSRPISFSVPDVPNPPQDKLPVQAISSIAQSSVAVEDRTLPRPQQKQEVIPAVEQMSTPQPKLNGEVLSDARRQERTRLNKANKPSQAETILQLRERVTGQKKEWIVEQLSRHNVKHPNHLSPIQFRILIESMVIDHLERTTSNFNWNTAAFWQEVEQLEVKATSFAEAVQLWLYALLETKPTSTAAKDASSTERKPLPDSVFDGSDELQQQE